MNKLIRPQNTLKEKVGDGGFKEEDLKNAQEAIEENTVDFKPIALELLKDLDKTLSSIQKNETNIETLLGSAMDPLMQLRAQGSLFHYPSITHISDIVVDFLDTEKSINENIIEILVAYKKAAEALLSLEIKNEKDKTCLSFLNELEDACLRYRQRRN